MAKVRSGPGGGIRIDSEVQDTGAQVAIRTLWQAAEMVRKGALTNQVMDAAFVTADAKFNAYMATEAEDNSQVEHVFDWNQVGSASGRLWRTWMTGRDSNRFVTFSFQQSRKKVPLHPKLEMHTRRRHIFREKAAVLEEAGPITISRKQSRYLVYVARNEAQMRRANEDGIVFQKNPSQIEKAGGGYYENQFTMRFLAWWASDLGGGGEVKRIAEHLGDSFKFQAARTVSAQNRLATYTKRMNDTTLDAKARENAKKMVKAIERQMTVYGRKKGKQ